MKYKVLLALCLSVAAAGTTWAAGNTVSGEVLETQNAGGYTYLRLKTPQGETWAAVNQAAVGKGAKVSIDNTTVMTNFESKTLKKTFPSIVFGNLAGGNPASAAPIAAAKTADLGPIKVAKASGANAYTVADVIGKATALKDKPVRVAGKVVKYNPGIMGKNWVHLQDGSGAATSGNNDILVTTSAEAKLGETVTASGVVRTNKDFGAGYSYKVLIEEATLQR